MSLLVFGMPFLERFLTSVVSVLDTGVRREAEDSASFGLQHSFASLFSLWVLCFGTFGVLRVVAVVCASKAALSVKAELALAGGVPSGGITQSFMGLVS